MTHRRARRRKFIGDSITAFFQVHNAGTGIAPAGFADGNSRASSTAASRALRRQQRPSPASTETGSLGPTQRTGDEPLDVRPDLAKPVRRHSARGQRFQAPIRRNTTKHGVDRYGSYSRPGRASTCDPIVAVGRARASGHVPARSPGFRTSSRTFAGKPVTRPGHVRVLFAKIGNQTYITKPVWGFFGNWDRGLHRSPRDQPSSKPLAEQAYTRRTRRSCRADEKESGDGIEPTTISNVAVFVGEAEALMSIALLLPPPGYPPRMTVVLSDRVEAGRVGGTMAVDGGRAAPERG